MKILPMGAELFLADGRTDRYEDVIALLAILRTHLKAWS